MDLAGKVALVTGGSGDIGGAIAKALAAAGVDVAVSYVGSAERAASTVEAVKAKGRRALAAIKARLNPAPRRCCKSSQGSTFWSTTRLGISAYRFPISIA